MSTALAIDDLEQHRRELTAHCYRFFGSWAEAEDAVQEAFTRAWRKADTFEGRSSARTWLYRVATNVCLDMRKAPQRRALPMELAAPGKVPDDPRSLRKAPPETWIGPIGTARLVSDPYDPEARATVADSVRLAFLSALQLLPPKQRAVLLLRDVLDFSAAETAEVLEISVAAANSALARARRTLEEAGEGDTPANRLAPAEEAALLDRYIDAFGAYDVDRLVELLVDDARFTMPPYELWLRGRADIESWWRGPGTVCIGSQVLTTSVNAMPAAAVYHPVGDGTFLPFAVHALDMTDAGVASITHFMGADVFAELGLPDRLPADP